MRTVAVSDIYMKAEFYTRAFSAHPEHELIAVPYFGVTDPNTMREMSYRIERGGPEAIEPPAELWDVIEEAELLMVHLCPVPAALIQRAKKLRAILINRGGVENVDIAAAAARGISVLRNPAHNGNAVAELTVGLMIAEMRNVARADRALHNGQWRERFVNSGRIFEMRGQTVGLVGFGTIGHLVAEKLNAFGCSFLVYDPNLDPNDPALARLPIRAVSLPELMAESDIVSLHARANELILDASLLERMKPSAYFINTARPHLMDYACLYQMLREHKIMGAALEVHPAEPFPEDYPFLALDNVTLTNHRGGDTVNAYADSPAMLLLDYARLAAGERPRFPVNA